MRINERHEFAIFRIVAQASSFVLKGIAPAEIAFLAEGRAACSNNMTAEVGKLFYHHAKIPIFEPLGRGSA